MLNISKNRIIDRLDQKRYKSFEKLNNPFIGPKVKRLFIIAAFISLGSLFLPWTQNIQAKGTVTMRQPEQRPSEIQAAIAGQIAQWYAVEGDLVEKGDTIARLQEIKNEYLDPELIARTSEQLDAKQNGVASYVAKVS
ncbi:MAG: biotin/lipoyl-binding protein, partial [Flavobacteriales bacterium]